MSNFPPDRFPNEPPPATSFSSPQPSSMPPSQSSLRPSDEPDQFKISFLKGPKRKRLAKVCMLVFSQYNVLTPSIDILYVHIRPAMLVIRASGDATAPVSGHPSPGLPHAPVLTIPLAPCSNWYVPCFETALMGIRLIFNRPLRPPVILPPKSAPTQILPAGLSPRPWHQKLTSFRELRRVSPVDALKRIPTRNHQAPPQ